MSSPTLITHSADNPLEKLQGSIERVTFHSEASGFCVLRVKVKGHRDLITVIGSAAYLWRCSITCFLRGT
ncbi:YrrC family ATP-dependent DNA helicase [Methylomonas sp. LL1]|uniref:YrrC family ATP-dependent DNA helicase n=1 Tax=Methylomonas sp. LL1 TaxID=2785785 RepID=UPI003FA60423